MYILIFLSIIYYYIIYIYNIKYYIYLEKKNRRNRVAHGQLNQDIFFPIHFPLLPRNTSLHHMLIFLFIVFLLLPFWHFFQIMQEKKNPTVLTFFHFPCVFISSSLVSLTLTQSQSSLSLSLSLQPSSLKLK